MGEHTSYLLNWARAGSERFHGNYLGTTRWCRLSAGNDFRSGGRTIIDHHGLEAARHEGVNIPCKVPILKYIRNVQCHPKGHGTEQLGGRLLLRP